jgi:hypothetical protein
VYVYEFVVGKGKSLGPSRPLLHVFLFPCLDRKAWVGPICFNPGRKNIRATQLQSWGSEDSNLISDHVLSHTVGDVNDSQCLMVTQVDGHETISRSNMFEPDFVPHSLAP